MTAAEFLSLEIDDGTKQLNACLDGLAEGQIDERLTDDGMTIREILAHLAETCVAVRTANEGKSYDWGSYEPADRSLSALRADLFRLREVAKASCLEGEDDKRLLNGYGYLVSHDCYHIGQLALLRLKADPSWNSDALYGG